MLAVMALVSPGAWRRKAPFAVMLALGIAVPLNAPLIRDAVVRLPGFDHIQNQRMLLWFAFAVAVAILGAFGLQALMDAPRRQGRAMIVVCVAALAGVAMIGTISLAPGDADLALRHLLDRFAGDTEGSLALASVLSWLLFVAAAAVVLVLLRVRPGRPWLAGAVAVLAASVDLLVFAHAYQPMGPASTVFPPRTPAIAFLQRHAEDGRIVGIGDALYNDYSTVYGLHDVRGHDVPQPSLRYYRLWKLIRPDQDMLRGLDVFDVTPTGLKVLGLLGTRYIAMDAGTTLPRGAGYEALSYAYRGGDATVLENSRAMPRAIVAQHVDVVDDQRQELATVAHPAFDARRDVVVRRGELDAAPPSGGAGTVRVVGTQNARVTLQARLGDRSLVVLGDSWAPGWSVTVDGRPARAMRADVVMRGVVVPAGEHRIVWRYHVPGLRLGLLLSMLGLTVLLAWATGLALGARRRRAALAR